MRISYSKMNTYESCPQRFKLIYEDKREGQANVWEEFGKAMHEALDLWCKNKCNSKTDLLMYYSQALNKQKVINESGAYSQFMSKGQKMVYEFPTQEIKHEETVGTEYHFEHKLSKDLTIHGIIDRIRTNGQGKDHIEIIDYKTGQMQLDKHFKQMAFYGLASMREWHPKEITGTLHYLRTRQKKSITLDPAKLEEILNNILIVMAGITVKRYDPKPSADNCGYCSVREYCGWKV